MKKDIKFYLPLLIAIFILLMMSFYQISLINMENNRGLIVIMALFITGTVVLLSICYYKEINFDAEKAFKVLIPVIFILFFVCMPMFKNHDEDAHWIRIYDITQGNLLTSTEYGYVFAENSTNYPATILPRNVLHIVDVQYDANHTAEDLLNVEIDKEDTLYVAMPTTAIYAPLQYIPQAVGVFIADIFTDKPIIMAYVGRLVNMIFCYTVLYFAMKAMPFAKELLLVTMAIPIAVEGFTSLSPDGMTISMSILLIAYVLKLIFQKEKIATGQKITLGIICIVVALCKIVYLPLVGLVLLLPKNKFSSRKEQVLTITLIMLAAVLINLIWLGISSTYLAEYKDGRPVDQLQTLLSNPIRYLQMMLYTINQNGSKYLMSMFGGELGLNEHVILYSVVPYVFAFICFIAGVLNGETENKFNTYQTVIMSLIILAIIALVFTSLYIQWTKPEDTSIAGVQGRYFIPILPLVLLLLRKVKGSYQLEEGAPN